MEIYYLYQHRRLDTNDIFYVGMAHINPKRGNSFRQQHERAFCRSKRHPHWKAVAYHVEYQVEILEESEDVVFIQNKERELIKLYGRKNVDSNGTLVNKASGGTAKDGTKTRNVAIIQTNLDGTFVKRWGELMDIERHCGFLRTNIVKCCRKRQVTAYGYKWMYENNDNFNDTYPTSARRKTANNRCGIVVTCTESMETLLFRCQDDCAAHFGLHRSTVQKYLSGKVINKNYIFKYRTWDE